MVRRMIKLLSLLGDLEIRRSGGVLVGDLRPSGRMDV